jgi:hypothetical protein
MLIWLRHNDFSQRLADRGRMLEPVPRTGRGNDHVRQVRMLADHKSVIGGHHIQTDTALIQASLTSRKCGCSTSLNMILIQIDNSSQSC